MTERAPRVVVMSQYASVLRDLVEGASQLGLMPVAALGLRAGAPDGSRRSSARVRQIKTAVNLVPLAVPVVAAGGLESVARLVGDLQADLVVTRGFPWRLTSPMLGAARLGMVNVHPSPLPKYRGAFPVHHAILNGDTTLSATAHWMTPAVDSGNILQSRTLPMALDLWGTEVWSFVDQVVLQTLAPAISAALEGRTGVEQDESAATWAESWPPHAESTVHCAATISREMVHRLARAFSLDGPSWNLRLQAEKELFLVRRTSLFQVSDRDYPVKCLDGTVWLTEYVSNSGRE